MENEEEILANRAIDFIKQERQKLIQRFANHAIYQSVDKPVSLFMAGSPGAGKTEVSKRLIQRFEKEKPVRIDPDEIRDLLPGYNGANAYIFQGACSIGVDKLYDHVVDKKLNVIVDGTFASERSSFKNIERSIKHQRKIEIYYIYQEPTLAWQFTQVREAKERRRISKEAFVAAFINSRQNVNRAKHLFGDRLELNLIVKNFNNNQDKIETNIDNVDNYLPKIYTVDNLNELIGL